MTKDASPKGYVWIGAGISRKKEETVCSRQQGNRICHVIPEDAILRAQDRLKEVELFSSLGKGIGSGWHLSQTGERCTADSPGKPKHAFPFVRKSSQTGTRLWLIVHLQSICRSLLSPLWVMWAGGPLSVRAYGNRTKFLKLLPIPFTTNSDR